MEDEVTRRRGVPVKAYLVFGFVAGLTACGGGGGPSAPGTATTPPGIHAQEITITPPENQAPEAVGTIPDQTLTEGGNARSVDVAQYFNDPDGDPLTWSARSGDPGVVTAGMSGSTVTLTPVSDGTATVTVTAGDGNGETVQSIAVTVRQRQSQSQNNPSSVSNPPPEPEIELTGVNIVVAGSKSKTEFRPHTVFLRISPEPEGAQLGSFGFSVGPSGNDTGTFTFSDRIGDIIHIWFRCHRDFTGVATITFRGGSIVETFTVTCR